MIDIFDTFSLVLRYNNVNSIYSSQVLRYSNSAH